MNANVHKVKKYMFCLFNSKRQTNYKRYYSYYEGIKQDNYPSQLYYF